MKKIITSTLLVTFAFSIHLQAQTAIGLNTSELRSLRKVIHAKPIADAFSSLSNPLQRILSDGSVSLFIIYPNGEIYYRSGRPTAGNIYAIENQKIELNNYHFLLQILSNPKLTKFISDRRASENGGIGWKQLSSAFNVIEEIENPLEQEAYLALYGDLITDLNTGNLIKLREENPEFYTKSLSALSLSNQKQVEKITNNQTSISENSVHDELIKLIEERLQEINEDDLLMVNDKVSKIQLDPDLNAFLKSESSNLEIRSNEELQELIQNGQIEIFIGETGTENVEKITQKDLKRIQKPTDNY